MRMPVLQPHGEGKLRESCCGVLAVCLELQHGREAPAHGLGMACRSKAPPVIDKLLPRDTERLEP
eukprot:8313623-Pyramimonas_sp.AAC.1